MAYVGQIAGVGEPAGFGTAERSLWREASRLSTSPALPKPISAINR